MTRVLALHGMTLNSATMRRQLGPLRARLERTASVEWLDAPHVCPKESVDRHYAAWGMPIPDGPHLCWWNASEDGRTYEGWSATLDLLSHRLRGDLPPVLFGFSQGAIVATAAAILSFSGALPPIAGVVLVAGFPPRAPAITRHYHTPLMIPSLHVWGTQDRVVRESSERLVEWFAPGQRRVLTWQGAHSIPRRGPPGDALISFVKSVSEA